MVHKGNSDDEMGGQAQYEKKKKMKKGKRKGQKKRALWGH